MGNKTYKDVEIKIYEDACKVAYGYMDEHVMKSESMEDMEDFINACQDAAEYVQEATDGEYVLSIANYLSSKGIVRKRDYDNDKNRPYYMLFDAISRHLQNHYDIPEKKL